MNTEDARLVTASVSGGTHGTVYVDRALIAQKLTSLHQSASIRSAADTRDEFTDRDLENYCAALDDVAATLGLKVKTVKEYLA